MGPDERLRRYQEAGADFIETARARAEELLRELGGFAWVADDRAEEARETGGRGPEQLLGVVRREVAAQLSALGFATRADLDDLEARLERLEATCAGEGRAPARKAAATKRPASARKVSPAAKAAPTKRAPGSKRAAPASVAGPARATAPLPATAPPPVTRSPGTTSPASRAAARTASAARKAVAGNERRPRS